MHRLITVLAALILLGCGPKNLRFATFNASMNRDKPGQLLADLTRGDDQQIKNVAEIIQRTRPDVLLINEFDYDPSGQSIERFRRNYLNVSQNGTRAIDYPYSYSGPVNTGVHSGLDLDNNGKVVTEPGSRDYGGDCFGFGLFPGQYGMVVLSRYPIDFKRVRSFQNFKWKDMPDAMLPVKEDGTGWYDEKAIEHLRLSSKSHWDVPVKVNGRVVHLLVSHPTPPAFDGPEDRNGKRNHDEIRFWKEYLSKPDSAAGADAPRIAGTAPFIVMGDLNADPNDGGSVRGAIEQLLNHPRVNSSLIPASIGAAEASNRQRGHNRGHKSPAYQDTADFGDDGNQPGNLRCDYVLPSRRGLKVISAGVFWPNQNDPLYRLVEMDPTPASSDHRLVWVDVRLE